MTTPDIARGIRGLVEEYPEADLHELEVERASTTCTHRMTWSYLHPVSKDCEAESVLEGARIVRTHLCMDCGMLAEIAFLSADEYLRDQPVGSVRPMGAPRG